MRPPSRLGYNVCVNELDHTSYQHLSTEEASTLGLTVHQAMRARLTGELPANVQHMLNNRLADQTSQSQVVRHPDQRVSLISDEVAVTEQNFEVFLRESFSAIDILLNNPNNLAQQEAELIRLLNRVTSATYSFFYRKQFYNKTFWNEFSESVRRIQNKISTLLERKLNDQSKATLLLLSYELAHLNLQNVQNTIDIFADNLRKAIAQEKWEQVAPLIAEHNSTSSVSVMYELTKAPNKYMDTSIEVPTSLLVELLKHIAPAVIDRIKFQNASGFSKSLPELSYLSWLFSECADRRDSINTFLDPEFGSKLSLQLIDAYASHTRRIRGGEPSHGLTVNILWTMENCLTTFPVSPTSQVLIGFLQRIYNEKVVRYNMDKTVLRAIQSLVDVCPDISMQKVTANMSR